MTTQPQKSTQNANLTTSEVRPLETGSIRQVQKAPFAPAPSPKPEPPTLREVAQQALRAKRAKDPIATVRRPTGSGPAADGVALRPEDDEQSTAQETATATTADAAKDEFMSLKTLR